MTGEIEKTASAPEVRAPVSSVKAPERFALDGVAKKVATLVPRPETPVLIGRPVALVRVPDDGVPSTPPLTTNAPADPTLTPRAVKTPVPAPVSPVLMGRPVPLVKVIADGVPRFGVVRVGEVLKTATPVPVSSVRMLAKLADVSVPKYVEESPVILPAEVMRAMLVVPNSAEPWTSSLAVGVVVPMPLLPAK